MKKLDRDFYLRDGITVARDLIGKILAHRTREGITKGRIVETEAYMGPGDKASHAYRNTPTKRTVVQFGEGGFAYVYLIYGMYYCMNVVANGPGVPQMALIRALQPVDGIDLMQKRRGVDDMAKLCSGPGKLCVAMDITKSAYGLDLCGGELYIEDPREADLDIVTTKRLNIDYADEARDFPWRFIEKGNPFLSVKEK